MNDYDENILLIKGTKQEMLEDDENSFDLIDHINDVAEAIERLENDCCKSRVYCELYPDACMKEECEIYMAIEALKERPTGIFCIITFLCGTAFCALVGINLYEDWRNK